MREREGEREREKGEREREVCEREGGREREKGEREREVCEREGGRERERGREGGERGTVFTSFPTLRCRYHWYTRIPRSAHHSPCSDQKDPDFHCYHQGG